MHSRLLAKGKFTNE
jgi:hypothetical protein